MQSLYTTPGPGRFSKPQVFSERGEILMLRPQATGRGSWRRPGLLADLRYGPETFGVSPSLKEEKRRFVLFESEKLDKYKLL